MVAFTPPLPEFVFRGTTYNFEGNRNCNTIPYRCYTSVNPVKASYFASVCRRNRVIYIAETRKLIDMKVESMLSDEFLSQAEEEIIWVIKPLDFYKYCEGYITVDEMNDAFRKIK